MPINVQFGGVNLTGNTQREPSEARRDEPNSLRIGVIGDFRARGTRGLVDSGRALTQRRRLRIDRDNLDAILARLGVELALDLPAAGGTPVRLAFRALDDFHPDRILADAEAFAALRTTRQRLLDPKTADDEVAAMSLARPAAPAPPTPPPATAALPPAALLDLIVQQSTPATRSQSSEAPKGAAALDALIDQITAPYTHRADPRQAELIGATETTMAQILRDILHHPEFQALESLWRAVDLLTRRLETGSDLTIELLDLTRAELEGDLVSATPLESTAAFKLLVEESVGTEGGRPWTLLVGDFTFGPSARDVAMLWRLGQVARLAGAPFVAAASPRFVGCDEFASSPDPDDWGAPAVDEAWSDLRHSAEAPFLGLALPRVLLRAPYGPESQTIESFGFAEFSETPAHESYLWGNPAFAVALVLGPAFDASGHFDSARCDGVLSDLPLVLERDEQGETRTKPCAEVLLSLRAAERIAQAGVMPVLSVRDQGIVRLARLVSIAEPAARLGFR